eukprot:TRINITY_DN2804_c0_g1_i1.p1 TRINITY_DN2804_c0_g1~~TRINITY_DN2804_c0_g1_i1.p1  ORF type:complete len:753 (+),score=220.15 TRINITY_DN2804_c0_g1_i1:90-2261(+)
MPLASALRPRAPPAPAAELHSYGSAEGSVQLPIPAPPQPPRRAGTFASRKTTPESSPGGASLGAPLRPLQRLSPVGPPRTPSAQQCASPSPLSLRSAASWRGRIRPGSAQTPQGPPAALTVDLWARCTGQPPSGTLLAVGSQGCSGIQIGASPSGRWVVRIGWRGASDGGWADLQGPPGSCVSGRWDRITVSCDETTSSSELWINGVSAGTASVPCSVSTVSSATVGSKPSGATRWRGELRGLAVYWDAMYFASVPVAAPEQPPAQAPPLPGHARRSLVARSAPPQRKPQQRSTQEGAGAGEDSMQVERELQAEIAETTMLAQRYQWLAPVHDAVRRRGVALALRNGTAARLVDELRKKARTDHSVADHLSAAVTQGGGDVVSFCVNAERLRCLVCHKDSDGLGELRADFARMVIAERLRRLMPRTDPLPEALETLADAALRNELVLMLVAQRLRKASAAVEAAGCFLAHGVSRERPSRPADAPPAAAPTETAADLMRDCIHYANAAERLGTAARSGADLLDKWVQAFRPVKPDGPGHPRSALCLSDLCAAGLHGARAAEHGRRLLIQHRHLHDSAITEGLSGVVAAAMETGLAHYMLCDRFALCRQEQRPAEELLVECADDVVRAEALGDVAAAQELARAAELGEEPPPPQQEAPSFGLALVEAARVLCLMPPVQVPRAAEGLGSFAESAKEKEGAQWAGAYLSQHTSSSGTLTNDPPVSPT